MRSAALSQDGGMIGVDRVEHALAAGVGRSRRPRRNRSARPTRPIRRRNGSTPGYRLHAISSAPASSSSRVTTGGQRSVADIAASSHRPARRYSRACAVRGRACRGCSRRCARSRARRRPSPPCATRQEDRGVALDMAGRGGDGGHWQGSAGPDRAVNAGI